MSIPFIDIHTHHPVYTEGIISIPSLFLQDIDIQNVPTKYFSAAIHPWHASNFTTLTIRTMLENLIMQPGLIAIGETGLDKVCKADYQQQKLIFELHLEFAKNYHKPLIIHAVKSWNELIEYFKLTKVPLILHGYSEGIVLTRQLINLGCNFSLGKSVLQISPRFREAIQIIPLDSLFLETDDSLTTIIEIYQEVSAILGLSVEELKNQIYKNFNRLFL
jgi:TatD DNase family protein